MERIKLFLTSDEVEHRDFQNYLKNLLWMSKFQYIKKKSFLEYRDYIRQDVINAYRKKYKQLKYPYVHADSYTIEKFLTQSI